MLVESLRRNVGNNTIISYVRSMRRVEQDSKRKSKTGLGNWESDVIDDSVPIMSGLDNGLDLLVFTCVFST